MSVMTISPERMAEIQAVLDEIIGPRPKPKPKVVVSDGVPIRDADVVVSPKDPNARCGRAETVFVRRADYVAVNMSAADAKYHDNLRAQEDQRRLRKEADPIGMGHWGRHDE
jgi:hypothetical protein